MRFQFIDGYWFVDGVSREGIGGRVLCAGDMVDEHVILL